MFKILQPRSVTLVIVVGFLAFSPLLIFAGPTQPCDTPPAEQEHPLSVTPPLISLTTFQSSTIGCTGVGTSGPTLARSNDARWTLQFMNNTGSAWTDFHLELMGGGAGAIFLVSSISVTPAGTATLSAGDRTCDICFTQPVPVGGMVTINFIVRQSSAALQRLALERID